MRNALVGGFKVSDFPANDMDDLEIKKRARRRLVGAAILALLAVVALPLVLKNEPRTVPDIQVIVPERGEPGLPPTVPESSIVDIEPDAASGAPGFPVEVPLPEESLLPPAPEPEQPVAKQPVVPPPVTQPSRQPRQEKPPSRSDTAEREAEAARALALLNNGSTEKEADKGGKTGKAQGQVFIQVGAYSKAEGAARQVEKLKKQGFAAYAEKSGKVIRIRIGPLSRSEGERVKARLEAKGHKAELFSR